MNSTPLFSILVANYNNGSYLQKALDSAFNQTYDNYEIIIVDDGSTDNSRDILAQLQTKHNVKVIYNNKNRGCGYTKWECIERANGEICGFMDADDALTKDALEIMVKEHLTQPDASIIYSRCFVCDKMLNIKYVSTHQCSIPEDSTFLEYKRGAISHFVTFKKSFYKRTVGMNKELRMSEDLDLYYKLEEVGKTHFIDKPLYYYRTGTGENTSLGRNLVESAMWEVIAKTDAFHRRNINLEKIGIPLLVEINDSVFQHKMKQCREYKLGKCILHPKELIETIKRHL